MKSSAKTRNTLKGLIFAELTLAELIFHRINFREFAIIENFAE